MNASFIIIIASTLCLIGAGADNVLALPIPLVLFEPEIQGSNIQILAQGTPSMLCVLQGKTEITSTNWVDVDTNILSNYSGTAVFSDSNAVTLYPQRFYRLTAIRLTGP